MSKSRNVFGLVAAVILVLSSAAHSILGWKGLREQLAAAHVPPDLERGVQIGWQFGGVAMLAFGLITFAIFLGRLRGELVPAFPALVIGITYLAFGAWALAATKEPFFTIFLVPGALLVLAASRR